MTEEENTIPEWLGNLLNNVHVLNEVINLILNILRKRGIFDNEEERELKIIQS